MRKTVVFYILSALFICAMFLFSKFIRSNGNEKTASDNPIDGFSKRKAGDYQGAKADFDKAIEQNPTNFKLYNERGLCKQDLSEYNDAIKDYKKAIELNYNYADAYYNMGWCKFQIGDKTGACSDWQKSVDYNGQGQKELETCCNADKKQEEIVRKEDDKLEVKKDPPSPETKKVMDMFERKLKFHGDKISFSYVYLNDAPYGRIANIYYDDFYKTYSVSFFNSTGEKITFKLKDSNFTETWGFVYNGGKYELTNYQKGRLYY
jgi:tetratricopeptide (TPR) repeat protein